MMLGMLMLKQKNRVLGCVLFELTLTFTAPMTLNYLANASVSGLERTGICDRIQESCGAQNQ